MRCGRERRRHKWGGLCLRYVWAYLCNDRRGVICSDILYAGSKVGAIPQLDSDRDVFPSVVTNVKVFGCTEW